MVNDPPSDLALVRKLREQNEALDREVASLKTGGGGGTSGGMEPRVAKLEAHVEHIRAEIGKLAPMPADLAAVRERLQHLPTKDEVKGAIDAATDRLGTRVQRTVAVIVGLAGLVLAGITAALRIYSG